jgi:hypothetical protein
MLKTYTRTEFLVILNLSADKSVLPLRVVFSLPFYFGQRVFAIDVCFQFVHIIILCKWEYSAIIKARKETDPLIELIEVDSGRRSPSKLKEALSLTQRFFSV